MFRKAVISLLCALSLAAAGPENTWFLDKAPLAALVSDSPAITRAEGYFSQPPALEAPATTDPGTYNRARVKEFLAKSPPPPVTLKIEWLNQNPPPADFLSGGDGEKTISSSLRMGATHITRTVVSTGDALIFHFLADKPGDLSFRASLIPPGGKGETAIHDRRELVWSAPGENGPLARAWIIPFESDVESEGSSITLRGEGECLVIFNFAPRDPAGKPVETTWQRLIDTHDPDAAPPDPTKIWAAIREKAGLP